MNDYIKEFLGFIVVAIGQVLIVWMFMASI